MCKAYILCLFVCIIFILSSCQNNNNKNENTSNETIETNEKTSTSRETTTTSTTTTTVSTTKKTTTTKKKNSTMTTTTSEKTPDYSVTAPKNFTFRNTFWGMSKEEVKKGETASIIDENEKSILYGEVEVANKTAELLYNFTDDKLSDAIYIFDIEHTNYNLYIEDYNLLLSKLSKKYGEPDYNEEIWSNDLFKDDESDWGLAVSVGDLSYQALWKNNDTVVVLVLIGDNYDIDLCVSYYSSDYLSSDLNNDNALDGL